jgi:hypothetical protein
MKLFSMGFTLLLMVDVSVSVDDKEYALQRAGIANAFLDPVVQRTILSQGEVCVSYVEWSSEQRPVIGWTRLKTAHDINSFAFDLLNAKRSHRGTTQMATALPFALDYVSLSPCGGRIVIDVSGDGCQYGFGSTALSLQRADSMGVQINGLTILGDPRVSIDCQGAALDDWYREHVAPSGFVIVAEDFDDFFRAMRQKLALEIAGLIP